MNLWSRWRAYQAGWSRRTKWIATIVAFVLAFAWVWGIDKAIGETPAAQQVHAGKVAVS